MSILILGHGQHGKDEFASRLVEKTGLKFTSSSEAAFEVICPVLMEVFPYNYTADMIYELRREHRELWRKLILLYNTPDRTALSRLILKDNDIYVGMRSAEEFEASRHLFDKIMWVDAMVRTGLVDESMEIEYDDDMIRVDNNGTLEDLQREVERVSGYC